MNVLLRHRAILIALPIAAAIAATVLSVFQGRKYSAQSSFLAQVSSGGRSSGVASMAAQFGINLGGSTAVETAGFYRRLLVSRELLRDAVLTRYSVDDEPGQRSGDLISWFDIAPGPREGRVRRAIGQLSRSIAVGTEAESGLILLTVTARSSELSVAINRRMLELLNDYNLRRRQSQAKAERVFIEQRLTAAKEELAAAEDRMREFLEQNRRYEESPQLSFEATRLERDVTLRQQVYSSLAQAFEQARIEEVRENPVITLIELPETSTRVASTPRHVVVALGAVLGLMAALLWIAISEYLGHQARSNPQEFDRFRQHWRRPFIRSDGGTAR